MPPRTLASLAHALAVAPSPDAALQALGDALAEFDRYARIALISVDERREMLRCRSLATPTGVASEIIDTMVDHLPTSERARITTGGQFVDFGDASDDYARLLHLPSLAEAGWLSVRGIQFEGALCAILAVYEAKKLFGVRTTERIAPAAALFELAYLRFLERDARAEAVRALEDITQRIHGDYDRKLAELERQLKDSAPGNATRAEAARIVALERDLAQATEAGRRALRRADAVEATVGSAVGELEKAHVELHRRSEQLRQRTRTLYLIDRVLTLDCDTDAPRQLADGLLALIADDMHAHRCSLMLRTPEGTALFIAASKGIAPGIVDGTRVQIGRGISGQVAATREPILVYDVAEANQHPLLHDEYFTTGSFMSFPLVYRGELVGVVNLANRAHAGVFVDEDVDRVRLLGLVIALVASSARLPERLVDALGVR
ncbi:MAG TPA: GAF domain-containing protein [Gemmatimonadaceae bacterium]|nr:GAF domain-containing protein [Gemmatimonadaceae bacterium]